MILEMVVGTLAVALLIESLLLRGKIAHLEGMCYGLIATIKGMEREREENAVD